MAIVAFIGKRLAFAGVLLLTVSFLVYGLLEIAPGSPLEALLGGRPATPEQIERVKAEFNLDDPFLIRYGHWLLAALQLDFGNSLVAGIPTIDRIGQYLPTTIWLNFAALVLVIVIGVPLGMAAGIRRGKLVDRLVSVITVVGMSAPPFALGLILMYIFGVLLGWLPVFGGGQGGWDSVIHLVLPSVALATGLIALVARQTRASTLTVMQEDSVLFARARGLAAPRILWHYALRNSAMPVITITGLLIIYMTAGTVLIEEVFSLPGVGSLLVHAVLDRDIPVIQAIALFLALIVVIANLAVDILTMLIDPRTRYATRG